MTRTTYACSEVAMLHLSDSTLPALARRLEVPQYERDLLLPSIVHIGVGGFHRAHQAVYLDDLARLGSTQWGEVGVGLRSPRMRSALLAQDRLFTVVEHDSRGESARVVGALRDYLFAPDDPRAVLTRLADPHTRIVSMTITGDGYNVDSGGSFRHAAPGVLHDLRHPEAPTTWFGYVCEALSLRRRAGLGGFTLLSCDNLADSGATARTALLTFAGLRDETLARWIERNVSFPNAMVDRITPEPDEALRRLVARRFGVHDQAPVATESFTQWVVEDAFCQGRPPLEDVGVQVVTDVSPFKLIKTRLLNGTHSAMAYLGWLAGYRTTSELVGDPTMRAFLTQMMLTEVAPLLPRAPGIDTEAYVSTVLDRLGNQTIADPLARLCRRGSTKVASYLLPSLLEARRLGRPAPLMTLALAGWFRYLRGTDLQGHPIEITDAMLGELQPLAVRGGCDPRPLLNKRSVMGPLADDLTLQRDLRAALRDLESGVVSAVASRLGGAESKGISLVSAPHVALDAETDLIS
jgi:mannitol 2-dehydrogenase